MNYRFRKRLTVFLLALPVLYGGFLVALYFLQQHMVFHQEALPQDHKFNFDTPFEEIRMPVAGDATIHGLLFKTEHPKGLILYLHGNGGTVDGWGTIAPAYTSLGYDIFIPDYRGFGKSIGDIKGEEEFLSDMQSSYDKMKARYGEDRITVIGYSIGTGAATWLSSRNSPTRLILQAPYYNFSALCDDKIPVCIPDFIKKFSFPTNEWIGKVKCPITIFHGTDDSTIPVDNGRKLARLLKAKDHYIELPQQGHGGMNENPVYLKELRRLMKINP